jgi:hypothetical protein
VRLGDAGDPGQRGDGERLGVVAIHRVARAEQPAVAFFDARLMGRESSTTADQREPQGWPARLGCLQVFWKAT